MADYDDNFYDLRTPGSLASARATLGHLWKYHAPGSVIDVGCGTGTWLQAAAELGSANIVGIEGEWLKAELAVIPFAKIKIADLKKPIQERGPFDLAISVEVAEHLPESRAEGFINDLTGLSKVVLFSAAVPSQGGTGHINEQWPQYWSSLFASAGYLCFDAVRPAIWESEGVDWWYAQNAFLYVEQARFGKMASAPDLQRYQVEKPRSLVHPGLLKQATRPTISRVLRDLLPAAVHRSLHHRFRKKTA